MNSIVPYGNCACGRILTQDERQYLGHCEECAEAAAAIASLRGPAGALFLEMAIPEGRA